MQNLMQVSTEVKPILVEFVLGWETTTKSLFKFFFFSLDTFFVFGC